MTLATLISSYGYPALVIGTFLEGETILVLGGLAAHLGYLKLSGVILSAFAGSFLGDQLFFFLGRRHSGYILDKRPAWQKRIDRAHRLLAQYETPMILGFRFIYGMRTITPFVLGTSKVRAVKYMILNAIGAAVWATAVAVGGYFFGHAVEPVLGEIKHFEVILLIGVSGVGLVVWFVRKRRHRHHPPEKQ